MENFLSSKWILSHYLNIETIDCELDNCAVKTYNKN